MAEGNQARTNAGKGDVNSSNVSDGASNGEAKSSCVSTNSPNLGYANLHGNGGGSSSNGFGYPHGLGNVYGNWHGSGGGGGSSAYMSPHGLGNVYADWHGSRESSNLHCGHPNLYGSSGGSSRAVERRTPGHASNGWSNNGYGAGAMAHPWPIFNGMYAPQQAPANNLYAANAVPPFVPNGGLSRSPLQTGLTEFNADVLISDRLRSLCIGDSYVDRRNTTADSGDGQRQQDRRVAGEHSNSFPRAYAADPYRSARLESVRGKAGHLARYPHGCQFLRRMVDVHGADAVRVVFDEIAGDVVRLMGHRVGAVLVDDMAMLWTDEQVACVLRTLGASLPREVMMAARNNEGSNVLQRLISRIEWRRDQIDSFTRCLASAGEHNLLALIKDQAGSRVIQKCLETFSPEHNLFIVGVVMQHRYRISYDPHGCHTMKRCIDHAIDVQTRDCLVAAVCLDGLALAQDDFGNYVVQHVIRAVPGAPWATERLHAGFRGRYASLSRKKASSNVVQQCLEFFPQVYSDQIVCEILDDPRFPDLISDPYANYVLQSAIRTTKGELLQALTGAVRPYRNILRDNMHARKVLHMLFNSRRRLP